ncbi:MAG TPA: YqgE/AlgH family protein, partial [Candidatus Manganitrophaceae bacterium]|nr:YqgE/AlgH family protein [Candidatus Manganitrophaceae bacterium]
MRRFSQKMILAGWLAAIWALFPGDFSSGLERGGPPERKIAKGLFLVADPRLADLNFRESVVLIVRHGSDGTIGVIINRPTAEPLSGLRDLPLPGTAPGFLFFGGPVSPDRVSFLVQTGHPVSESAVLEEVYFTFDPAKIPGLLKESKRFRVYVGYAGWGPGQLEGELNRGDWRLLP